jgi:predicted nucleotide-binding protein
MPTKRTPAAQPQTPPQVQPEQGIVLLERLVEKARVQSQNEHVQSSDEQAWSALARDYLTRTFGSGSPNISAVLHASGDGGLHSGMSDWDVIDWYRSGFRNKIKVLESCIEQLQTDIQLRGAVNPKTNSASGKDDASDTKVFVVHGRNHGYKEAVARFLERLDLDPVILHEKANEGRTIIQKFSDFADVQFAVVLLTADDEGRPRAQGELTLRARQNVILELGYFLGRLGHSRVCALYEKGVEIPSDYQGVLFVEIDQSDQWRFQLVKELRAAGFVVDANKIFGG